ncbi:thioredoxin [Niveomyces insectorum RCEF 264]|uniref:Thioredoxin n=1 Tax=Niveomyces insectorum RCEF 264 TaxID=1081102 RepID=A0A167PRI8_9HYPO|nr:thioredoxin [Niveomyces insectorum RCEF 264]
MSAARTLLSTAARARPASSTFVSHRTTAPLPRFFHATAPTMTVHELTSKAAFDAAVKEHKTVILDATAVWCGPCKMISPVLEKLSEEENYNSIFFAKFDVDQVPDLTQELGIRAMPTFLLFQDGNKVDSMTGANPPALTKLVAKYA